MNSWFAVLGTGLIVVSAALPPAYSQQPPAVSPPELGVVEKLGDTLPLDAEVYDERGYLVPLRSVITKPTVITFVYYRCPSICSPQLTEVARVVDKVDLEIGVDYQIVTISFNHREPPSLAAEKKESYLNALKKKIDPAAWRFFTADSVTVRRLTDAAGFYFKPDGVDFIHAAALIITSPEGKITRYINGIQYLPFDVKMAVMEASEGRTGPTIAKLLKFCYSYDPEAKTYTMSITRVGGIAIVVLVVIFSLVFLIRPKKKAER